MAEQDKLLIRLHVYDTDLSVRIPREDALQKTLPAPQTPVRSRGSHSAGVPTGLLHELGGQPSGIQ